MVVSGPPPSRVAATHPPVAAVVLALGDLIWAGHWHGRLIDAQRRSGADLIVMPDDNFLSIVDSSHLLSALTRGSDTRGLLRAYTGISSCTIGVWGFGSLLGARSCLFRTAGRIISCRV